MLRRIVISLPSILSSSDKQSFCIQIRLAYMCIYMMSCLIQTLQERMLKFTHVAITGEIKQIVSFWSKQSFLDFSIVSVYDQEIPQPQSADKPVTS